MTTDVPDTSWGLQSETQVRRRSPAEGIEGRAEGPAVWCGEWGGTSPRNVYVLVMHAATVGGETADDGYPARGERARYLAPGGPWHTRSTWRGTIAACSQRLPVPDRRTHCTLNERAMGLLEG